MEAKELRICNWYAWESEGKEYHYQVEPRDFVGINYKNFKPIPLTEEWLLDFGFKKDSNGHYRIYHGRNIPVRLWKRGKDDWVCIKSNARPKYVHQLQNLYYSLTGQELIKK